MKRIPAFAAILALAVGSPGSISAQPSTKDAVTWVNREGKKFVANFVRMSGDHIVVERDGREYDLSASLLSPESAAIARKLAGLPAPRPAARNDGIPPMKFVVVGVDPGAATREIDLFKRSSKPVPGQNARRISNRFIMGSPPDEPGRSPNETQHTVWLTYRFFLKTTEVTWAEWSAVRRLAENRGYADLSPGVNPAGAQDTAGRHPVTGITWWDAIKWCNLLSELENRKPAYYTHSGCQPEFLLRTGELPPFVDWTANGYRLPTEAEWEFACRKDRALSAFHTGPIRTGETGLKCRNLEKAGWFAGNSNGGPHPVATKKPDHQGLYDMHGNVAEWCWDNYSDLRAEDATDPRGNPNGELKIIRGGSWQDHAQDCRAASRRARTPGFHPNPFVGFRLARSR